MIKCNKIKFHKIQDTQYTSNFFAIGRGDLLLHNMATSSSAQMPTIIVYDGQGSMERSLRELASYQGYTVIKFLFRQVINSICFIIMNLLTFNIEAIHFFLTCVSYQEFLPILFHLIFCTKIYHLYVLEYIAHQGPIH